MSLGLGVLLMLAATGIIFWTAISSSPNDTFHKKFIVLSAILSLPVIFVLVIIGAD